MYESFASFLMRNSNRALAAMPLVHTTEATNLKKIGSSSFIEPQVCDFFGDKLNYFFVGRPAYKKASGPAEASYWQLPSCFIFEYETIQDRKRVFPFDSGAFKSGRMPEYIKNMDIDYFQSSEVEDAPLKIIGAYFHSLNEYFRGRGKGEVEFDGEYALRAFDDEIRALHRLSQDKDSEKIDDRRLSVEVQSESRIDLKVTHPLAVIIPSEYLDEVEFIQHIKNTWNAEVITYSVSSLSISSFYGQIYEKVSAFYKQRGYL